MDYSDSIFDISPNAQDEYESSRAELIRYINLSPRDDADEKLAELYAEDIDKIIIEGFRSIAKVLQDESLRGRLGTPFQRLVELYDVRLMA